MGQEREFYTVPEGWPIKFRCHQCKRELVAGDQYYMTDDDSWILCRPCASGRERPRGPRPAVYAAHEREPLHKRETLREQVERCQT
jgi:hypothetical protein